MSQLPMILSLNLSLEKKIIYKQTRFRDMPLFLSRINLSTQSLFEEFGSAVPASNFFNLYKTFFNILIKIRSSKFLCGKSGLFIILMIFVSFELPLRKNIFSSIAKLNSSKAFVLSSELTSCKLFDFEKLWHHNKETVKKYQHSCNFSDLRSTFKLF